MRDVSSLAISADGQHLAVGDGPELLTYLATGAPVWKHFCDGILIDVAYAGPHLVTIDSDGRVTFFRAVDGRKLQEVQLEGVVKGSMVSPDGRYAALTSAGIVIVEPNGQTIGYPYNDVSVGTFGPDASSMGIGTSKGMFTALDSSNGQPWGAIQVPGEVSAAIWNPRGFWMFTSGNELIGCDGSATEVTFRVGLEGNARALAVTQDGAIAAVLTPPGRIALVELYKNRIAGHVIVRREVQGIACQGAKLAIGFDDGDASTVDLISRNTIRTEPHPGRGRNNWNLDLSYDVTALAGAITNLRAGGQPIAEAQYWQGDDATGGGGCWGVGCVVMNVLFFSCVGIAGLAIFVKYMQLI